MLLNLFVTQIFALPWDEWGGDIDVYIPFPQTQVDIDNLNENILAEIKSNLSTGNGTFEDAVILTLSSPISSKFGKKELQAIATNIRVSAIRAKYIIFDVTALTAPQLAESRKKIYDLEQAFIAQTPTFKVGALINYSDNATLNDEMINLITQDPNKNAYLGVQGDLGGFIKRISNTPNFNYQAFNENVDFFDLSETEINETNIAPFIKYLATFHNLIGLDLTGSLFKNFSDTIPHQTTNPNDKFFTPITTVLKNLHKITFLKLSSNALDENSAIILANTIKSFDHLIYINVNYNYFGGKGADAFLNSLSTQSQLASLNISNNKFNAQNADALVNAIKNKAYFVYADISYNFFASEGMHKIFLAVSHPLILQSLQVAKMRKNYYLHKTWADKKVGSVEFQRLFYLDMGENYFYSEPAQSTTEPSLFPPTLKYLYLDGNNISSSRMATLSETLVKSTHIHYLDISKNNIGAQGIKPLLNILENSADLDEVNLSENNLNASNMVEVAKALTTFPLLKSAELSKNTLNKEAVEILAKYLSQDRKLKRLRLSGVELSDESAVILASGLNAQKDLAVVDLSYNNIDQNGLKAILESLKDKTNFTTLALTGNKINCDTVENFINKPTFKCL